jgi:CDP-diacylglycerol--glycerol-3-phosphate 3-phosphatidyltransferase
VFDGRFRTALDKGVRPIGSGIQRTGVTADHLTGFGLVVAAGCALTIATGHLFWGFVLLVASALPDLFDGAVAKASGTASDRGAFFDSVADRVSDSLVLGGIAWHLASTHGSHAAMLPFAVLGASTLISYMRAKAESLGYAAKGGLMERAERVIALCAGLLFSALLVPVLWITLVLTMATAVQRFVKVWRQASAPPPKAERLSPAGRWREWRAAASTSPTRASRRGAATPSTRWQARRAERLGTTRVRLGQRRDSGAWRGRGDSHS